MTSSARPSRPARSSTHKNLGMPSEGPPVPAGLAAASTVEVCAQVFLSWAGGLPAPLWESRFANYNHRCLRTTLIRGRLIRT